MQEVKKQNLRLKSLVELNLIINSNHDLASILDTVKFTCIGNFMPEEVEIFLKGDELAEEFTHTGHSELDLIPLPVDLGVIKEVERNSSALLLSDEHPEASEFFEALGNVTKFPIIAPIFIKEKLWGLLLLGPRAGDMPYLDEDIEYLNSIAHITATALENARLIDGLKELNQNLEHMVLERTKELEVARDLAEHERKRSDKLLLNILPEEIANEIKVKGVPEPRHYESVSILFTDFKDFTRISESMTPARLVQALDECFSYFDQVTELHGLEKFKTIGDAYMCGGGIPLVNQTHPIDAVLAALEILHYMQKIKILKDREERPFWDLRMGINTGPLVAGVIGTRKFAYDVWGDTVNVAARMESSCEAGKINLSRSTYDAVKDFFDCSFRGELTIKGKGDVEMYFVESIKEEFRELGNPIVPNEAFIEKYKALRGE